MTSLDATTALVPRSPSAAPGRASSDDTRTRRDRVLVARLVALAVVLAAWHVVPQDIMPDYAFGRPLPVLRRLVTLFTSGDIFGAFAVTFRTTLTAMIIAAPIGVAVGLLTAARIGRWFAEPIMTIGYAIPKVGMISLFILWLGLNRTSHVALVFMTVVFVYFFGTRQAMDDIDQDRVTAFRLMGAGPTKLARSLLLPAAVPSLLGATRLALPAGFGSAVFAEIRVPTRDGMGVLLNRFALGLHGDGTVAMILVIGGVAYSIDVLLSAALRRYVARTGTGMPAP